MNSKSRYLVGSLLLAGVFATSLTGCVVRDHGHANDTFIVEGGFRHEGYFDEHHNWHGGYYDDHHVFHNDDASFHHDDHSYDHH